VTDVTTSQGHDGAELPAADEQLVLLQNSAQGL